MNIQEYINSGIIEDYCLGVLSAEDMQSVAKQAMLYPEIQQEIDAYEQVLKIYAAETGLSRQQRAKQNILDILDNLDTEGDIAIDNLPLINRHSSAGAWLRFVKPMLPVTLNTPSFVHELPGKDGVEQFIYWTNEDVPDEIHSTTYETLLVLEGRCRCFIEDEVHELGQGDFLAIPLFKSHNVQIIEGPVMAVMQRVKVA